MTASAKNPSDWVIVNTARDGRFECLRCGGHHDPQLRLELGAYAALMKWFEKAHRGCRLKPEGLHCGYCGETGHAPEACKRLDARTPEQWLYGPDTGISSRTIWAVLYGGGARGYVSIGGHIQASPPRDPSDFARCHRLLKLFPACRGRLGEVAEAHPEWAHLVEHWDELDALYVEEHPTGTAPKLYARMRELLGA